MWGFAREYVWQNIWDKLLDTVGEDPFNLMFYGTYCVTSIVYWTVNKLQQVVNEKFWLRFQVGLTYLYCDLVSPEWMQQYKIQPGTNQPIDKKKLK